MGRPHVAAPQAVLADVAPAADRVHLPLRLNPLWRQPPVYSPLPRAAVTSAVRESVSGRRDAETRLRDLLRREYAADHVILCASGTMALQLAIRAAIDQAGDATAVALPAFTCYDVATAAVGADARVALYDIDPETLGPDLGSLEAVLRAGAGVIVVAHLFGVPVDWEPVERLAADHGAVVIEDAAQGHGADWNGRRLGALGKLSVLSFGRGKGWTGGGGGALLVRSGPGALDPSIQPQVHTVGQPITLLRASVQSALGRPALYGLPAWIPWLGLGETRYHPPSAPEGMGQYAAAILMHSRAAAEREAGIRRRNAYALAAALTALRHVSPFRTGGAGVTPGFLRFPARVIGGFSNLAARDHLARLGVAPSYPKPLGRLQPISSRLAAPKRRLAGAETLARELVTLPTHSLLTHRDRQQMLRLLGNGEVVSR